ncbi:MAG: SUMF1/EgtB/PvdO family nonheme iron enzyme [Paludibacter sp.]|nr:SUMF1/EgtB/PvdO family nonheme iron enzyme [Paludibacter sp.]
MKTKSTFITSALATMLLLAATTQSSALNYTIGFTASGVTTSVGSIQVQNLTKNTTVTVPNGNTLTLTLTDQTNAVDAISVNNDGIRIRQNASTGKSTLIFYAKQAGSAQVYVYAIDGGEVVRQTSNLDEGDNAFELSLPTGIYAIHVSGKGYAYSTKLQSQRSTVIQAEIIFMSNKKTEVYAPQKNKATPITTTTMTYSVGDQLLYTATSDTYISSVPDIPTANKVINFSFTTIPTSAIPTGTFAMGTSGSSDEVQHFVTLSAYSMSKYEITNAQYAAFLNAKGIGSDGLYLLGAYPTEVLIYSSSNIYDWGLHYSGSQWIPVAGYENNPVINVTWYGATEFATYLGGKLPTEAQWEYACRAGTNTPFSTGTYLTNLQANFNSSTGKTQPGGTYSSNAYGLYDMHGNVQEWCSDWEGVYPISAQTNPTGSAYGTRRIVRGGSWIQDAQYCRSAFRNSMSPYTHTELFGFRAAFVQ